VRSVDPRRETLRAIQWRLDAAALFGTLAAETILASGLTAAQTGRTHGRMRPNPQNLRQTLAGKGPSTQDCFVASAPRNDRDVAYHDSI
jgi:hypothetical protein